MKKVLLIAAVVGFATACKKDRTCECNVTPNSGTAYTVSQKMYKVKKSDAHEVCNAQMGGQVTSVYSGTTTVGDNWDCKLK